MGIIAKRKVKSRKPRSGATRLCEGPNDAARDNRDKEVCRITVDGRLGEGSQGQYRVKYLGKLGQKSARHQLLNTLRKNHQRPWKSPAKAYKSGS